MHVVAVMNYKGGVGKTTLTANLAAEIASGGYTVLMIDLDPQANLTFSFYSVDDWQDELRESRTIKRWYDGDMPGRNVDLADLILTPPRVNDYLTGDGRLDLISSHLGLIDIDLELAAKLGGGTTLRENKRRFLELHGCLLRALQERTFQNYDIVLIDCAPNFGLVTKTAIVASDHVLIPAKADYLSTLGIRYLVGSCEKLVEEFNDYAAHGSSGDSAWPKIGPNYLGVAFTMTQPYAGRPIASQAMQIEEVAAASGLPVFRSTMRNSPKHFGDAGLGGIPAMVRAPVQDDVAIEFRKLTSEFVERLGARSAR